MFPYVVKSNFLELVLPYHKGNRNANHDVHIKCNWKTGMNKCMLLQ